MPEQFQFEFATLGFPCRHALRIAEVAAKLQCSDQHVLDLIEEGRLGAINIAGAGNVSPRACYRVPVEEWEKFVRRAVTR